MKQSAYLFSILLILTITTVNAFQGKVVGVSDGDTISVMNAMKPEKIRLYGVDCPEKAQGFGQRAKQFTSDKVFGKIVEVDTIAKDRYGRTVGLVRFEGKCLNEELIRSGLAWLYRQYCDKPICSQWGKMEDSARANKTGLWSFSYPIAPWAFRHHKKKKDGDNKTDSTKYALRGNTSSHVFHTAVCEAYNCKNCSASFQNRTQALNAGYQSCGKCQP